MHVVWDRSATGAGFVLTIPDREPPGAGFANMRDLRRTRVWDRSAPDLILVLTS